MERMPDELWVQIFKIVNTSRLSQSLQHMLKDVTAVTEAVVNSAFSDALPRGTALVQVCRKWRALFLPCLYERLTLSKTHQFEALAHMLSVQSHETESVHHLGPHFAQSREAAMIDPSHIRSIVCAIGDRGAIGFSDGLELCRILSYTSRLESVIARVHVDTPWLELLHLNCADSLTQLSIGVHPSCLTAGLVRSLTQLSNLQTLHLIISSEQSSSYFFRDSVDNSGGGNGFTLSPDTNHSPQLFLPGLTALSLIAAPEDRDRRNMRSLMLRILSNAALPSLAFLYLTVGGDTFDGIDFCGAIRPFGKTLTNLELISYNQTILEELAELAPNLRAISAYQISPSTKLRHPFVTTVSVQCEAITEAFVDDINLETLPCIQRVCVMDMCWSTKPEYDRISESHRLQILRGAIRLAQRGIPLLDSGGLAFGNLPRTYRGSKTLVRASPHGNA